jgi:hypothetical protein
MRAEAQYTGARQDEEVLFVDAVMVNRERCLARRYAGDVRADRAGAESCR